MIKIIHVTFDNVPWASEQTGLSYDELLDLLNEATAAGYVCTVQCPSS